MKIGIQSGAERSLLTIERSLPSSTRVAHSVRDGTNGADMRIERIAHPSRHAMMAITFVIVLVASFFALAPAALACHADILFVKEEPGAAAPGDTYTIRITEESGRFDGEVEIAVGAPAAVTVPPGTYHFEELNAPVGASFDKNPVTVTEGDNGKTITVIVTNPYPGGWIEIEKVESGDTAPAATYTFDILAGVEIVDTLEVVADGTATSRVLPLGDYTIVERDAPDGHTLVPNPVTIDEDGETVTVIATNPYRDYHGKLAIQKIESGDTAPGATYTFDIVGPDGVEPFTAEVKAGETWTSGWLPLGDYTVTERDAPDGHTLTGSPAKLTEDGATVTVIATNPYRDYHGKLAIQKIESGSPLTVGTYTINVSGPKSFSITLKGGETWTSDWLPLGTYTVTEVDAPTGATIVPNPAVLQVDGATVTVVVTNPTLLGSSGTLPATGGGLGVLPWIAATMFAIGATLLIVVRGSRRHA